jgi:hypothetical protein
VLDFLEEVMLPATANRNASLRSSGLVFFTLCVILFAVRLTALAEQPDRISGTISNSETVVLKGSVHPMALAKFDQGPVEPSMKLPFITLLIQPSADQQAALKQLLAEQQDPSSPNYHKWLTPESLASALV